MRNDMKRTEEKRDMGAGKIAIVLGLCFLAVLGGFVWYSSMRNDTRVARSREAELYEMQKLETAPVTLAKTPTIDETQLEREKQSADDGEAPEAEDTAPATDTTNADATTSNVTASPVFAYPLEGDVVLGYSIDSLIFDPTLEQYRTNASVSLSAPVGSEVKATADGEVKEIKEDDAKGTSLVVEHANGWLTTYSQLEEDVFVNAGDAVVKGQALGVVTEPSAYSVALGAHLDFAMEQNGASVNPLDILQK